MYSSEKFVRFIIFETRIKQLRQMFMTATTPNQKKRFAEKIRELRDKLVNNKMNQAKKKTIKNLMRAGAHPKDALGIVMKNSEKAGSRIRQQIGGKRASDIIDKLKSKTIKYAA